MLAAQPGRVVPVHRLIDELWADEPPERALATLQAYVSRLRRALEPGRSSRDRSTILVSRAPGYLLSVTPAQVDAARFTAAVEGFEPDGDPAALTEALLLWRGDPLPELGDSPFAQAERSRLQELRFTAIELRSDALLAWGRPRDVIPATESALAESPYRERLWSQLMLALYRAGRQAEALNAYARARTMLAEDLGIEPGPALQKLEKEILRQSPALNPPAAASKPTAAAPSPDKSEITEKSDKAGRATAASTANEPGPAATPNGAPTPSATTMRSTPPTPGTRAEAPGPAGAPNATHAPTPNNTPPTPAGAPSPAESPNATGTPAPNTPQAREVPTGAGSTAEPADATRTAAPDIPVTSAGPIGPARSADAGLTPGPDPGTSATAGDRERAFGAGHGDAWVAGGGGERAGLVGRDAELAVLDRLLDERGRGRLLLVSGSPGIGKSALLRELAARASAHGYAVGIGTGVDGRPPPVFVPWAQVLRGVASTADKDALAAAFAPFGNLPAVLDPALADVLPLPAPERLADAELARSRLFQGIVNGLRRLSTHTPLLLILDDAHLLDKPSATLLTLCARTITGDDILLATGFRDAELDPGDVIAGLKGEAQAVRLRLEGLNAENLAELGARIAGAPLARETIRTLLDRSGGNPFFAGELVQELMMRGRDAGIPVRVQEVLRRRLERLPGQVGAVLAVASVLGREFDVAVLREMTQLDELELYDTLDTAVVTGLVHADFPNVRFVHDLLRQAAYEQQGPLRRARLHARAGRAIRAAGGSATDVAAHLRLALPVLAALEVAPVLGDAAGEAYERTAHEEAAALLEEALTVLLTAKASEQRDVQELDLRVRLAFMHQATDDYLAGPVAEQYALMEPVLRRVRDVPGVLPALWGYASFHTSAGNPGKIAEVVPPGPVADVHAGYAAFAAGDLPRARELFRQALRELPAAEAFPIIDWDPRAGILGPAAAAESLLGNRAAAEQILAGARGGSLFQRMYLSQYAAGIAVDHDDPAGVAAASTTTFELAERGGHPEYRAMAQTMLGWANADEALLTEGEAALGETLWRYPRLLPLHPDLLLRAGRRAEAAQLARDRLVIPLDGLNRFAEPELRRVLGAATGDRAELERALRLARDLGHAPAAARIAGVLERG
ncbi:BTAD domain-containing putative transcriptional regulator [Dactylosporangium sp. CA-233914]|uniref:BTAD domain-containing putative transcriptional regulator n=1 Tax=Dactylosporangium sp. CA-233914 TaxID=3239934 RepID=UPI003D8B3252